MSIENHLEGHLPANHRLSPHWQYGKLPLIGRMLSDYPVQDLWETDFARLPRGLARQRRQARLFAEQYLIPAAAELDLASHLPAGECHPTAQRILCEAGKQGWLSFLMPAPFGDDSGLCRMLRTIAPLFEHRLFLSATPHNGHTRSFTGLLE